MVPENAAASRRSAPFSTAFAPDGTPLVDREAADAAIEAALARLAGPGMPALLRLPMLPRSGPVADALRRALSRLGLDSRETRAHARACLRPEDPAAPGGGLRTKQRKEAARQLRRLAELGPASIAEARDPGAVAVALSTFLAVEGSGWKGRRGSALASREATARFAREAVGALAREGQARIVTLSCGASPAALGILLGDSRRSWFWKIAYDEGLARFSPGTQLSLALAGMLHQIGGPSLTDSCAAADHPMIDRVWRGRREFSDLLVATRPGRTGLLALAAAATATKDALKARARRLRGLLDARG